MFGSKPMPKDIFQPHVKGAQSSVSVLFITADKTEDLEFFYPYYRFIEEGFKVDVVTPDGSFEGKNGTGLKETLKITDVDPTAYDLLYIPGGKAPAALKKDDNAVELVKRFAQTGKPLAAICHAPQLLAAANVIQGRNIAAWPDVEDEVADAGGLYMNQETCVDGPFITARWPADLPAHVAKTLQILRQSGKIAHKAAA